MNKMKYIFIVLSLMGNLLYAVTPQIYSGANHAMSIKSDGTLWAWGRNNSGEFGDGTTTSSTIPVQIGSETTWSNIYIGYNTTMALKADGTLWAWGENGHGQLGDGTTTNRYIPTQIGSDTTWSSVSMNYYHTTALKSDGTLWAWGDNDYGLFGDGTTTSSTIPVQIGSETTWSSIFAGFSYILAIKADGTLWAWGLNFNGELGDGTTTRRYTPVQIGSETTWSSISAGKYGNNLAIKADGTLWAWGDNEYGQLGDGTTTNRYRPTQIGSETTWSSISAGYHTTMALKADGTLWAWGRNNYGEFGDGTTTSSTIPVQIGSETTWSNIYIGYSYTIAQKADGTLWAWGDNEYGQLGDGTTTSRTTPYAIYNPNCIGEQSLDPISGLCVDPTCVGDQTFDSNAKVCIDPICKAEQTLVAGICIYPFCIGDQTLDLNTGVCVNPTCAGEQELNPYSGICVEQKAFVVSSAGSEHTTALKADGTLWAWGYNNFGQLGDGSTSYSTTPIQIGSGTTWNSISAGSYHAAALKADGTLWAWGYNYSGQLGDGTTTTRTTPVQIGSETAWSSISAGSSYTTAIKADGTLWAWGSNYYDGTTTDRYIPTQIGNETTWSSISAGSSHIAALKVDGTLWAWGDNDDGQLGDGTQSDRYRPVQIGSETTWRSVSASYSHTLAIKEDGTLWAWGDNTRGKLGDGTQSDRYRPVQIGSEITWRSVSAGMHYTTAIKADGTLWAWGYNYYGQLGDGTTTDRYIPTQIGNETTWSSISVGRDHAIAIKADGTLWAWGENGSGQLGDGTMTDRTTPYAIYNANCIGEQSVDPASAECLDPTCVGDQTFDSDAKVCINPTCIGDQALTDGVCVDPTCIGDQALIDGVCVEPTCIGDQTLSNGVCRQPYCGSGEKLYASKGVCAVLLNYSAIYADLQQGDYESDSNYEVRLAAFNDAHNAYVFDLEPQIAYDANREYLYATATTQSADLEPFGVGINIAPVGMGENVQNFETDMYAMAEMMVLYSTYDDKVHLVIKKDTIHVEPLAYQSFELIDLGLPLNYIDLVLEELQKGWWETTVKYEARVDSFYRNLLLELTILPQNHTNPYGYNADRGEMSVQVDLSGLNLGVKTYTFKVSDANEANRIMEYGQAILTLKADYTGGHISIIAETIRIISGKQTFGIYSGTGISTELFNSVVFRTGQDVSYLKGDDGDSKLGRLHDYSRNGTLETVTDSANHLTWQDSAKEVGDWDTARNYCAALNVGTLTQWRLPSKEELSTITNMGTYNPALDDIFVQRASDNFWTETGATSDSTKAWSIDFDRGNANQVLKTTSQSIRCVHGEEQVIYNYIRDDAKNTVYEHKTNLTWYDGSIPGTNIWSSAIANCENLNYGGYSDWRLPNINEMRTIVDSSRTNYSIHNLFTNTSNDADYWTSTVNRAESAKAWTVEFTNGTEVSYDRDSHWINTYRCVRGVQISQKNSAPMSAIVNFLLN